MFRASFKKEKENVFDCKNSHDKPCRLYKKKTQKDKVSICTYGPQTQKNLLTALK